MQFLHLLIFRLLVINIVICNSKIDWNSQCDGCSMWLQSAPDMIRNIKFEIS